MESKSVEGLQDDLIGSNRLGPLGINREFEATKKRRQNNFLFDQGETLSDAVSWSCAEWNVSERVATGCLFGKEAFGIECKRVGENGWIAMKSVDQNEDVASGRNNVLTFNIMLQNYLSNKR